MERAGVFKNEIRCVCSREVSLRQLFQMNLLERETGEIAFGRPLPLGKAAG